MKCRWYIIIGAAHNVSTVTQALIKGFISSPKTLLKLTLQFHKVLTNSNPYSGGNKCFF